MGRAPNLPAPRPYPANDPMSRCPTSWSRRRLLRHLAVLAGLIALPARLRAAGAPRRFRKWRCTNQDCDPYIYDPSAGAQHPADPEHPIAPGTRFEALPENWVCPVCGDPKSYFVKLKEWVEIGGD